MKVVLRRLDLVIVVLICGLQVTLVDREAHGPLRAASGLVFVTFLPGYALLAALHRYFRFDFSPMAHALLAIPISLALVTISGLALNEIAWTIQPERDVLWLAATTVTLSAAGFILSHDDMIEARERLFAFLTPVVALTLVAVGGTSVSSPAAETPTGQLALYVLDASGRIPDAPVTVAVGERLELRVGVSARGHAARALTLITPAGEEQALVLDRNGQWEGRATVVAGSQGRHKFSWHLVTDDSPTRSVSVWVEAH